MKIVCTGGGPAGLYFATSMKLRNPDQSESADVDLIVGCDGINSRVRQLYADETRGEIGGDGLSEVADR